MEATFVLVTCILASGCTGSQASPPPSSTTTTSPTPTSVVAPVYQVAADESLPNAKKLAAEVAQTVTGYGPSKDPKQEVVERLAALGAPASIADDVTVLFEADKTSRGEVVYPQLGGFANGKVSVMVATRQTIEDRDGDDESVVRVLDVRLQLQGQVWKVASIESDGGEETDKPEDLSDAERELLDNPNVEITDSARWDIYADRVDARLIDSLNRFSRQHRFSILVFAEGHPLNVFESDRTSNHTRGRAADVWKLDGNPIVSQRNDRLKAVQQGLIDDGITELGGPFDLDGPTNPRSFTDIVHHDHLHIAYQGDPHPR